jgi:hypothetical protein
MWFSSGLSPVASLDFPAMGMATLSRELSLYIDAQKPGGLNAILDGLLSSPPSYPPSFMAGDKVPLKVYFRQRSATNGVSTYLDPDVGATLVVAGRSVNSGTLLFAASSFTIQGTGTDAACFSGTIDLATAEIEAALASVNYGESVDMYVDIEERNAGNTERLTFRANCRLYKQVYSGETAPASVTLPPAVLTAPDGSLWQLTIDNAGQLTSTRIL